MSAFLLRYREMIAKVLNQVRLLTHITMIMSGQKDERRLSSFLSLKEKIANNQLIAREINQGRNDDNKKNTVVYIFSNSTISCFSALSLK